MRRNSIEALIQGVLEGDPFFILLAGCAFVALVAWGLQVGRRRRREKAERENK